MTQALEFAKEMEKAVDSLEKSEEIAARYEYKKVFFRKHNRRGLRFADGSKLFIDVRTGKLTVPLDQEV